MNTNDDIWAIVLAAGAGTRLSVLTQAADGAAVPKQFCSLTGAHSLLDDTLARAANFAPAARTLCVVAAEHARWWGPLRAALPVNHLVEQPRNRGTGVGIMLALSALAECDERSLVVLLPSDHFVRDEQALATTIAQSLQAVRQDPRDTVLIGITPEEVDSELGYIVPGRGTGLRAVSHFVEKPDHADAARLISAGALWNSFIMVGSVGGLLDLCALSHEKVLRSLRGALRRDAAGEQKNRSLARVYARLPDVDFSRHVVPGNEPRLRVLAAPPCGWTDLGTPRRVARCLEGLGARWIGARAESTSASTLNLAQACHRLGLAR